jgi:hypothetical protein
MEETIIKETLLKYGLEPTSEMIKTYISLIQLGFNNTWLRNMCIIKQFDEAYKTNQPTMDIYLDISIDNKDLSINQIRKIIRDRQLYEI